MSTLAVRMPTRPLKRKAEMLLVNESAGAGSTAKASCGEGGETESGASVFHAVPRVLPDPVEALIAVIRSDSDARKVNLGIGTYVDGEGKPFVLSCVRKAEARLAGAGAPNKEYLPFFGHGAFVAATQRFCFGAESAAVAGGRVCTVQTLSGTGALRIGGELVRGFFPGRVLYLPDPSWVNHEHIFTNVGVRLGAYRYLDRATLGLDLAGLVADLSAAPRGSVVLLHVCAHNPTGVDPSAGEWEAIADVVAARGHLAFFDCAYQGFASGDAETDSFPVRLFEQRGLEFLVAQSFSKIAGLYSERVGALNVVCKTAEAAQAVLGNLKSIIRLSYLSPPAHGAAIVATILDDAELALEWKTELRRMIERVARMRVALAEALRGQGTPGTWDHIERQIGMFAYTGLKPEVVARLATVHHVYVSGDGRINVAGLTEGNLPYVAEAIHESVLAVSGSVPTSPESARL
eukprot:TRINITY_DN1324_c1_g1_i2.p2 TRINITY_DN1324_c1_g1~~TRINITY_DN1324_c1_g1_i2.p2  ORF type:complete len:473 (-),score=99.83 TRINITY_DN1324_c1_g1_i2:69-1454(-)